MEPCFLVGQVLWSMLPPSHPLDHWLYLSGIFTRSQEEIFGMGFALYRQKIFKINKKKPAGVSGCQLAYG
jgi:hypothetical protein